MNPRRMFQLVVAGRGDHKRMGFGAGRGPLSMIVRVLVVWVLCLSVMAVPAAAHASTMAVNCLQHLEITVTDFDGGNGGVHGALTFDACVSPTRPEITHGSAVVEGSAMGTPDNVTINEVDHITWMRADGSTVDHSTAQVTRRFTGPPSLMAELVTGAMVEGVFTHAQITAGAGPASREDGPGGSTVYHNSYVAYCDFPDDGDE